MKNINNLQRAIVAYLKGYANLVTLLNNSEDIKEEFWQGDTFNYPAVRVADIVQTGISPGCPSTRISFSIVSFSNKDSSQEVNNIAYQVVSSLHNKSFPQSGITFSGVYCNRLPKAVLWNQNVWMVKADFTGAVN